MSVRPMDRMHPKFSYQAPSMDHTRRSGAAFNNSMVHLTRSYQPDQVATRWRQAKWWDDSYKTMKTSCGALDWLLAARWMRTHHRVSATYVTCAVDVEMEPPVEHMSTHHMQLQLQLQLGTPRLQSQGSTRKRIWVYLVWPTFVIYLWPWI